MKKNEKKVIITGALGQDGRILSEIFITCFLVLQIVTPLPAANPSAFTTKGSSFFLIKFKT